MEKAGGLYGQGCAGRGTDDWVSGRIDYAGESGGIDMSHNSDIPGSFQRIFSSSQGFFLLNITCFCVFPTVLQA